LSGIISMESSIVASNGAKVMARAVQPRFIGWRVPGFPEGSWGDAFRERVELSCLVCAHWVRGFSGTR
jgi:hypothetical protein